LKLKRMMTKIGNDRYRMNAAVYVGRRNLVHRLRGFRAGGDAVPRSMVTAFTS
jgi:hypothetical protein